MIEMPALARAKWSDLTEAQPQSTKTFIERGQVDVKGTPYQEWLDKGIVHLKLSENPGFLQMIDEYCVAREALLPKDRSLKSNFYAGWQSPTSYLFCRPMMNIATCHALMQPLNFLFNESALLHLALTGWVSTERNWHQDSYLNPSDVWSGYAAVWIALDDIDVDSGPFEFVPGSHKWEVLRREKLFNHLPPDARIRDDWPSITQGEVARVCEEKIRAMGANPIRFTPKKGDVLVWHSNLVHRGTAPRNPDLLRKALILHYSACSRREDMYPIKRYGMGFYFDHAPGNGLMQ